MLELAILGLLKEQELHGYELKKRLSAAFGPLSSVSFVFGPRLPAHGRCVGSREELAKLASRSAERVCYVVEVCPGCSWNHLVRTFALGLTAR